MSLCVAGGQGSIQIHDLAGDGSATLLAVLDTDQGKGGSVHGHRLTMDAGGPRQVFDLRPDVQFRTLCSAAGRDYTKAERKLLPEGTPLWTALLQMMGPGRRRSRLT